MAEQNSGVWDNEDTDAEEAAETVTVLADSSDAGKRADAFLAEHTALTRSAAVRLIEAGAVLINGKPPAKNARLKDGDQCTVVLPEAVPNEVLPEAIPLAIVYEDADILVVNKPKGMVVHPAPGHVTGTLVNALLYHCQSSLSGIGGVIRPGIVHRIDKDTEGLLVVAKNDAAHVFLAKELQDHRVRRTYYAIVKGNFREDRGTVDAPIGRHPVDRKRMAVIRDPSRHSRPAVTHWQVMERFGAFTWIRCELETGRTHQIRVHMASVGHPLLGDSVYGGSVTAFEAKHAGLLAGQCLVASELRLTHPTTRQEMVFTVPLSQNFEKLLEILRKQA